MGPPFEAWRVAMPSKRDLKRLVRARMRKTGESYTAARAQVMAQAPDAVVKSCRRIIEISRRWQGEVDSAPDSWDPADLFRIGPIESELLDALHSLPPGHAVALQTIMYFGRGDDDDIRRLHAHLTRLEDDVEVAVGMMAEKTALPDYLEAGLTRMAEQGVDPRWLL